MLDSAIKVNLFLMQYCRRLVEDVADERMAEQPAPGVNHPAWVLGHLAWTADRGLEMLGAAEMLAPEWKTLFGRGSTPSNSRDIYVSKDELLRADAVGVDVDHHEEPGLLELGKAEVRHLDPAPLGGGQNDACVRERRSGAAPRLFKFGLGQHLEAKNRSPRRPRSVWRRRAASVER